MQHHAATEARELTLLTASKPRLPAWLLSTIVHLLVLIALGLCWQSTPRGLPGEQDRAGRIVIAQHHAGQETTYFEESQPQDQQTPSKAPAESSTVASSIPAAGSEASLLIPDIPLPGKTDARDGLAAGDDLLKSPDLTASGRPVALPKIDDSAIVAEEAARRRPTGPSGPSARVALFGSKGVEGHTFVFVVDRSKSMGSEGLGVLKAAEGELDVALAKLGVNHRFQIIAYHQKPVYFNPGSMAMATEANKEAAQEFFSSLASFGGTGHEAALLAALRLKPDVIFFLTDGGDPYLTASQLDRIDVRAGRRTSIHCLQFGFGALQETNTFMQKLASRTSGSYGYVDMSKRRKREF